MVDSFSVEVHENGVVIIPTRLGAGQSRVFDRNHLEDALLEMYRHCTSWNVGDRIKIILSKPDAQRSE